MHDGVNEYRIGFRIVEHDMADVNASPDSGADLRRRCSDGRIIGDQLESLFEFLDIPVGLPKTKTFDSKNENIGEF